MDLSKFIRGAYGQKDLRKFKVATKLISRGSNGSSSHRYSLHKDANPESFSKDDIVGISANGNRHNREKPDFKQIISAHKAKVKGFVTDNKYDRERSFNIGEREVAAFLKKLGYAEYKDKGFWVLKEKLDKMD